MKTNKILAFALLFSSMSYGQTLKDAIYKTENERFSEAATEFRKLIAIEPAIGCNYFYYGENFYDRGELDSAMIMWNKASAMDPESPLSYVGLGKAAWMKGDMAGAKGHFTKALTMSKNKNAEVMRAIAETYIQSTNKSLDEAITLLQNAIKLDGRNEDSHLLMGDALLEKTPENGSEAIKSYNKALEMYPKSPKAIVRVAKLYQRAKNFQLANEKYKEAQTADTTYAPAYRENAELNMMFKQNQAAIENWKKYLELNNSEEARYRYATAMFNASEYCEVIPKLESLQQSNYNNFYMERMLAYSYAECTTVPDAVNKGMEAIERFFAIVPAEKIIYLDYKCKGTLLSKSGKDSLAIVELERASALDEMAKKELAGEIGRLYLKMKKYDKVIVVYEYKASVSKLTAQEQFEIGRAYYFGPKDYVKADSAFTRMIAIAPSDVKGYFWRARAILPQDPGNAKWMAKSNYEKVIELIKVEERGSDKNKPMLIESSKYLGDYYVNSPEKDMTKAKEFWTIVITLDPNDAQAKSFFSKNGK